MAIPIAIPIAGRTTVRTVVVQPGLSMRVHTILLTMLAAAFMISTAPPGAAQMRTSRPSPASADARADARAALGLTVSASGTDRDTLGLLVSTVIPGGPADRAGIDEGNRLAEVNGVSLRIDPADLGQRESGDMVLRRLARALRTARPGDEVTLRVFGGGRYRTVTIQLAGGSARTPSVATRRRRVADTEENGGDAPVAAPGIASGATTGAVTDDKLRPATLGDVVDALSDLQTKLRRLERDEGSGVLHDTLVQAEQELGEVQRQLRAAQAEQRRRATDRESAAEDRGSRRGDSAPETLPGLRVTVLSAELASYFGDGSERGLLVLQADSSWDPVQTGDVILRLNGMPVDVDRLHDVLDSRRQVSIELLRRKRLLTFTLRPRD